MLRRMIGVTVVAGIMAVLCWPRPLAMVPPAYAASASPTPVVRLMPLGDSITALDDSYRARLWRLLRTDPRLPGFDFVGSLDAPADKAPDLGIEPGLDHEGHSGWRVAGAPAGHNLTEHIDGWLDQARPDVALLDIGTNDLGSGGEQGTVVAANLNRLLDRMYDRRPGMTVMVAALAPLKLGGTWEPDEWRDYNAGVRAAVERAKLQGHAAVLVDLAAAGLSRDELPDGIHPTAAGSDHMAAAWYDALATAYLPRPQGQPSVPRPAGDRPPLTTAAGRRVGGRFGRTLWRQRWT